VLPDIGSRGSGAGVPGRGAEGRPCDHVFLYRNAPVCKTCCANRLHALGAQAGVPVQPAPAAPHLRHALVNAGCPITTIQKLLGSPDCSSSTLIYARVHERTVAEGLLRGDGDCDAAVGAHPAG
jgi:site-specific recombinase XerD